MKYYHLLALGFFLGNISCSLFRGSNRYSETAYAQDIIVTGHRGEAAHFPENSIEGFLSAVKKGVDALEMDVVISADKKVVVSHEAFMAAHYILDPAGNRIPKDKERDYNLYRMSYDSIRKFDGGTKRNLKFPRKKNFKTYKPSLEEVIDSVDGLTTQTSLSPVIYMIELKSKPENYGLYQPHPKEFVDLVMQVVINMGIENRTIIKSFDPNILNMVRESYPEVSTSFLVSKKGIEKNLSRLSFTPDFYGAHHRLIKNHRFVDSVKNMNMKLIPWTVNRKTRIRKMLHYGVDGIITDYPERVLKELNR